MARKKTDEEKELRKAQVKQEKSDRMKAMNAARKQRNIEARKAQGLSEEPKPQTFTDPRTKYTDRKSYREVNGMPTYEEDPDRGLSAYQERFVDEYIKLGKQVPAVIAAGYKSKYPDQIAYQLMQQPAILRAIRARRADISQDLTVSVERVVLELAKIGFANMSDFVEFDGHRIRIKPDVMVDGAVINEISETCNNQGTTTKVKLHDKMSALKMLGQHLGMYTDKWEGNLTGKMTLVDLLKVLEGEPDKKE